MAALERRERLVEAALRVIAREGVAAATTRAIVAEAGMPLASFHYVFHSRDELISDLIRYVVDNEALAAQAALSIEADLRTTIRNGFQAFMDLVASDPLREQAMLELTQYALRTPELGDSARLQYDSYYRAASGILEAVAGQLGIQWKRPIPEMARILITFTDGLTMGWLVDRDMAATERVIDFAADALAALASPGEGS
ncbi:MAG TPA: TetR family transcriptional regulator [Candidatus Limnocylindrales bacterium]|nr:TetR family transcriptional regulator [Candidatus Limnocylindrales bacterium]